MLELAPLLVSALILGLLGGGHCIGFFCCGNSKGDGQHYGIAIGHDGNFHTVFCIMAIGHIDGIG